ncbi:Emsy N Terminus/ plant Tudor-like domains-containing protein isoform 1 [Hibiscus syriacus]|uniref:Emsy N Terminus/ plant Tudor-like domains-containing protein isoform 1 n=1 Tax=Hibiscus syriacus TaxID=106335 RepID=A0A6A2WEU1_HIBSY|nr:Emsy N Terminus/ plant Tudor-like domains-containing protein isoform 1 [Hibiscus syriacus]
MSNYEVDYPTVETPDNVNLSARIFKPKDEIKDSLVVVLVQWAPIAGSVVDQVEQVVGYVSLGYPFGMMASILFGRHHKAILGSSKPKLFVMGTRDGFTSVKQLENKLKSAAGHNETHLIEGVSHFEMEGPAYDAAMVELILKFIDSLGDKQPVL